MAYLQCPCVRDSTSQTNINVNNTDNNHINDIIEELKKDVGEIKDLLLKLVSGINT